MTAASSYSSISFFFFSFFFFLSYLVALLVSEAEALAREVFELEISSAQTH